jgi:FkbM family methyltransferase
MSLFRRIAFKVIPKVTGNNFSQRVLNKTVIVSQHFMGIGSGGDVASSGESRLCDILKLRQPPPYCIFDVGANKGQFLQLVLENISTGNFLIHCFEPGHETFNVLVRNAREDNRIKLNNFGIGKEKGEAVLHYDGIGSGIASLTKRRLKHFDIEFNQSETVAINTIDNYCAENAIDNIHLLKIDIEGHELDALAGARQMFEKKAIDIVTFEFGGCNIDTRTFLQDFWYFFLGVGMKLFRITPSGYLYPIESYKESEEQFRTTNFIALRNV